MEAGLVPEQPRWTDPRVLNCYSVFSSEEIEIIEYSEVVMKVISQNFSVFSPDCRKAEAGPRPLPGHVVQNGT